MDDHIHPVIRRHRLIENETTRSRLEAALSLRDRGILGLLVSFHVDENPVLPHLAPRVIRRNEHGLAKSTPWDPDSGDADMNLGLASAGFALLGCHDLRQAIDNFLEDVPFINGPMHFNAFFLSSGTIFARDDLPRYVSENEDLIPPYKADENIRAPICTVVLPPHASAHAAIDEHLRLAQDLQVFRDVMDLGMAALRSHCNLRLADPSLTDIRSV